MVCALGKEIAVQERACGATRTSARGRAVRTFDRLTPTTPIR
jgi:hypothetical protein